MFNIQGSELVFLLLIALLVLGPEKLPEAIRKFTKAYTEFKKVAGGFQSEMRSVLDEPMRELRGTADAIRQAATLDDTQPADTQPADAMRKAADLGPASGERPAPMVSEIAPKPAAAAPREAALNFGDPRARRRAAEAQPDADGTDAPQPDDTEVATDATDAADAGTPATTDQDAAE